MQTVSQNGLMELIGHEAIVLSTYLDSVGVKTIFVGHTAAAGPPIPVLPWPYQSTISDAVAVLSRDLERYEADVRAAFTVSLTQAQFDAAVSFHYNTGAIGYATWVKKFNRGDRAGAVAGIMMWTIPKSVTSRRFEEQLLFDRGIYSNGGYATLYRATSTGQVLWGSGTPVDLRAIFNAPPTTAATKPVQPSTAPIDPAPIPVPVVRPKPTLWARFVAFLRDHFHVR